MTKKLIGLGMAILLCFAVSAPAFAVEVEASRIRSQTERQLPAGPASTRRQIITQYAVNVTETTTFTTTYRAVPARPGAERARGGAVSPLALIVDEQVDRSFDYQHETAADITLHSSFYYDGNTVNNEGYWEEHNLYRSDVFSFSNPTLRHDYNSSRSLDTVTASYSIKSKVFGQGGWSGSLRISCDKNGRISH